MKEVRRRTSIRVAKDALVAVPSRCAADRVDSMPTRSDAAPPPPPQSVARPGGEDGSSNPNQLSQGTSDRPSGAVGSQKGAELADGRWAVAGVTGRPAAPAPVLSAAECQALTAMRKGATLYKYGSHGRPHFRLFTLSADGRALRWYSGTRKRERSVALAQVEEIRTGQQTPKFQRHPKANTEHLSFSLVYRSGDPPRDGRPSSARAAEYSTLDLVCKSEDELRTWLLGLHALLPGVLMRDMTRGGAGATALPRAMRASMAAARRGAVGANGGENVAVLNLTAAAAFSTAAGTGLVVGRLDMRAAAEMARASRQRQQQSTSGNGGTDSAPGWNSARPLLASARDVATPGRASAAPTSGRPEGAGAGSPRSTAMLCTTAGTVPFGMGISALAARVMSGGSGAGTLYVWGEGMGVGSLTQVGVGAAEAAGDGDTGLSCAASADTNAGDALSPALVLGAFDLDVYAISCGNKHMAALSNKGAVYTWGAAGQGALGHGPEDDQPKPRQLAWLEGEAVPTDVACGDSHTLLATSSGELYAWGAGGDSALLGLGSIYGGGYANQWVPTRVLSLAPGRRVRTVTCGPYHSALLTRDNVLYTWGEGLFGALGHGDQASVGEPREVDAFSGKPVVAVACGVWHTAAVAAVEVVDRAGPDRDHQTVGGAKTSESDAAAASEGASKATSDEGATATNHPKEAVPVPPGRRDAPGASAAAVEGGVRSVATADARTSVAARAVSADAERSSTSVGARAVVGALFTWGDPDKGRLGHGDKETALLPRQVRSVARVSVAGVACGTWHTVALGANGRLYTCGREAHGLLGSGSQAKANGAVMGEVTTLSSAGVVIVQVSCGDYHTAALSSKGEVYTWGLGSHGRLGHGGERSENTPRVVERLRGMHVRQVSCGSSYSAAICADDGSGALQRSAASNWELLELLPKDADKRVEVARGQRIHVGPMAAKGARQAQPAGGGITKALKRSTSSILSSSGRGGTRSSHSAGSAGAGQPRPDSSSLSSSDAGNSPSNLFSLGRASGEATSADRGDQGAEDRSSSVMMLQSMLEKTKTRVVEREAEIEDLKSALADARETMADAGRELAEAKAEAARYRAQAAARSRARARPARGGLARDKARALGHVSSSTRQLEGDSGSGGGDGARGEADKDASVAAGSPPGPSAPEHQQTRPEQPLVAVRLPPPPDVLGDPGSSLK